MHRQLLPAMPGILHNIGVTDVRYLLDHIQLAQTVDALFLGGQQRQHFAVFVVQVADRAQPAINQAHLLIRHGGAHAATAIVAGDQNMFDLQHIHRVLNHRQAIQVRVQHHVGHVAVYKQIAGQHADNFIGRYAGIRTTNP